MKFTQEHKDKISKALTGQKHSQERINKMRMSLIGRKLTDEHKCNIGKGGLGRKHSDKTKDLMRNAAIGRPVSDEVRQKISVSNIGRKCPHSKEHNRKIRLARLKWLHEHHGQVRPSYNPTACKLIEEYGKQHGYNFQHAENGGEYYIKELGYWLDGYDKEKNVVIEYYEHKHRWGNKAVKDIIRKQEIIDYLKCEFIEIKEWESSNAKTD